MLILIGGPIASGKSTIARALSQELGHRGRQSAVIDLDLVYEMLEPPEARKDDPAAWARARRAATALEGFFVQDGVDVVIVEGDVGAVVDGAVPYVRLHVSFDEACRRVDADTTRTFSRERGFLRSQHVAWETTPETAGLSIDTEAVTPVEAARGIADWALNAS